ncbi:hypothetical protein NLJ89_g3700 [Agrocybe chaxingu]|uniref:Uncharacterized protein n=1 Tax=Agrocybe chaxingu TaxID=84603 RepID=A0A9W8K477_9AGAR|nr:hypothetical protein NLJ89_g3700 [Agrocybe chaxingu]
MQAEPSPLAGTIAQILQKENGDAAATPMAPIAKAQETQPGRLSTSTDLPNPIPALRQVRAIRLGGFTGK